MTVKTKKYAGSRVGIGALPHAAAGILAAGWMFLSGCCGPGDAQTRCCRCHPCPRPCQVSDQYMCFQYQVPPADCGCAAPGTAPIMGLPAGPFGQPATEPHLPPAHPTYETDPGNIVPPAMPADSPESAINETMVHQLFATSTALDTAAPDVTWQPIGTQVVSENIGMEAGPVGDDVATQLPSDATAQVKPNPALPRLRATTDAKSAATAGEVPANNAGYQPPESRATIIPGSGQPMPIPPIESLDPAVGPDIESRVYPGFPGVPAPNASTLEPRSAQPQSTDVVR